MDCIGTKTIRDVIELKAASYQGRECLVFEDRDRNVVRYTYGQFDSMINRYANVLLAKEIKRGDKVIVHMYNAPEYLFAWFALAKIGAVMIPTNVLAGPFEMEYFADYSESIAVITEPDFVGLFDEVMSKTQRIKHLMLARTSPRYPNHKLYPQATILSDAAQDASTVLPAIKLHNEDDLMILFTSGSTSRPKAVQLTHANAVFAGIFGAHVWKVVPEDRHLIVLPLFHVNGQLISVMPTLTAGATLIIVEQFSASRYMEQVRAHRATTSSLVAANVNMILNQPIPKSELDSQNDLRLIMYAIAVPDETWIEFEARYNVRLCDLWGMTETLAATTINPIDGMMKRNCIGMARPGNEVKVIDEHGNEVRAGTVGEIVVKGVPGRTLMKGYYKNPVATAETITDGWLHTGDNAYMDEDGYFHFFDRKKDMIKRAGENVAATEVEYVIGLHPKVKEVAVIGVPDPVRDEAIMAVIILNAGETCSKDEIVDWCAARLAKFKVPGHIKFRNEFPRTSMGKVQKNIIKMEEMAALRAKR